MKTIVNLFVSTIAILIATYLLPHVHVDTIWYALLLAIVLAGLDTLVKPMLILFTLPATIFSLGLFLLVINAIIILLADYLIDGFRVDGFWWALFFSVVLSIITGLLNRLLKNNDNNRSEIEIR